MSEYDISPWMKKATPFVYVRISDRDQSPDEANLPIEKQTPIKDQLSGILDKLKILKLKQPKAAHIFYDIASGGNMNREGFKQLVEAVLNHKGRAYVALSEPSRWGRNVVLGNEAYAEMFRRDIPILSTSDSLMSGTITEPRPNAQFLFLIKQGVGEGERGQLIDRVKRKIAVRQSEGILPAGIGSLFPFARSDPLDVLKENVSLMNVPVKEGGGKAALGRLIVSLTAPNGPQSDQWWRKELERDNERIAKLSPEEYNQWYAFRKKWRALQLERDYDSQKDGPITSVNRKDIDWGMRAAQRYANGYLRYPFNPIYPMPSEELIQQALENPREYLSDNDKKLYRRLVDKKKVRR